MQGKQSLMLDIERLMVQVLDNAQMERLHAVLEYCLFDVENLPLERAHLSNDEYLERFVSAKRLEGCSEKSLRYYSATIQRFFVNVNKVVTRVTTDDLRAYLSSYQLTSRAGKTTIDNVRRILSSFFSWLEVEDYILKSPVRRIRKIKSTKTVKETYTDEALERMRDGCRELRDLAIVDMLASTGMRVGELVRLNRDDVDFEARECIVLGKGDKERRVYFDARTKLHLQAYLESRDDDNPALFISLCKPFRRLQISGVEIRLRELGRRLDINKVHPHKFRRTLATRAIDKGMPIEQVQVLLGHQKIDTTLQYAMVDQRNVRNSHRRYIA
ncbi:site-specific tyrosine recombinase/integron integrase [Collinsella sp. An271]|uniref:site-specific tyrosine recombinase/integron integrase n=2 Tax=Collinsella TaxID=102106 RepID=UPI001EF5DB31|nr:site-specific tyrosine recombinase/integron integrase [Collinsella sp. An271]